MYEIYSIGDAAFLYQGRLKRPTAAVKLHGRELSSSGGEPDKIRSYAAQTKA